MGWDEVVAVAVAVAIGAISSHVQVQWPNHDGDRRLATLEVAGCLGGDVGLGWAVTAAMKEREALADPAHEAIPGVRSHRMSLTRGWRRLVPRLASLSRLLCGTIDARDCGGDAAS